MQNLLILIHIYTYYTTKTRFRENYGKEERMKEVKGGRKECLELEQNIGISENSFSVAKCHTILKILLKDLQNDYRH